MRASLSTLARAASVPLMASLLLSTAGDGIAAAMVRVLTGVNQAASGFRSAVFWLPTLGGAVLFGLHLLDEGRRQEPILPLALHGRGQFAAAILSGIACDFARAGAQLQPSGRC